MQRRLLSLATIVSWFTICPVAARSGTFPQLISVQYDKRAALPDEARRPAVALADVDMSKLPNGAKVTATAKTGGGRIWLLTDKGPFRSSATGFEPLVVGPRQLEPGQPAVVGNPRITALVADQLDHIWVGTESGVFITDGKEWWQKLDRQDGVPFERISCLHLAPNGDVWAGTSEGAWRLRDGRFRYFWGKRWLPDNDVQAIWTDAKGSCLDRDEDGHREHRRETDNPRPEGCPLRPDHSSSATIAAAISPPLTCHRPAM